MNQSWATRLLFYSLAAAAGYQGVKFVGRRIIKDISTNALEILMTDLYDENLWEFVSATNKFTPQAVVETNLRAQEGQTINRPLGSPRKFPSLDQLMFNIAQLDTMPTPLAAPIDTKVIIGKACQRPLIIDIPIMIAGMAYGAALSESAKIALAKGSALAGTATNTGEGPFLPSERSAAAKLIIQYNRGSWNKSPEIIKQADAIEIQFGQGASAGVGHKINVGLLDLKLQRRFGVLPGQSPVLKSRHTEVQAPSQLYSLVQKLKNTAGDIPVGIKLGAGKHLENDMKWAVDAGVDYIVLDGAEAATKGSPPIMQDDFGVPTIFAIARAGEFLRKHQLNNKVSLIASGKIRTPGDMLKALALGADAVYIGGMALFAISHIQVLKALPYEPPTQLVWYDGKLADRFNPQTGAKTLHKYLNSCRDELIEGIRALGKTSIQQVNKSDMFALDELTAKGVGVPMAYEPSIP